MTETDFIFWGLIGIGCLWLLSCILRRRFRRKLFWSALLGGASLAAVHHWGYLIGWAPDFSVFHVGISLALGPCGVLLLYVLQFAGM